MKKVLDTAIRLLLPSNLSSSTLHPLVTFCIDKSYFEFNEDFYFQDSEVTLNSTLQFELAEKK